MIIDRYIRTEITRLFLGVTFGLLLIFTSQQMVRYLNMVTSGKVAASVFFKLISIEIPYLLSMLMPIGFYLAILLNLHRLYIDQEMVILKQMGLTPGRLCSVAMQSAMPVVFLLILLMFYINPSLSGVRQLILHQSSATAHLFDTLTAGRFQITPDGKNVIYATSVSNNSNTKIASHIFMAKELNSSNPEDEETKFIPSGEKWQHKKTIILLAQKAYEIPNAKNNDRYFVAANGFRYQGTPTDKKYEMTSFGQYIFRLPNAIEHLLSSPEEMLSISQLWKHANEPHALAELQWRISIPLSIILLTLFALPISHMLPRQHRVWSLLIGILSFLAYFNLLIVAKHWVEAERISPRLGIWWVHGLFILIISFVYFFKFKYIPRGLARDKTMGDL